MNLKASLVLVLAQFCVLTDGFAKNIFTITLNSSNEAKVQKRIYYGPGEHFFELVPENKNPAWLDQFCSSGVSCDVVLISGHFGGLFFGEKNSQILDLKTLERHSCEQSCVGLTRAKEVYLMGCNTLAEKTPDHRSVDEYRRVLVEDGFSLKMASETAFARYADYGMSFAQRVNSIFQHAEVIYGFGSKAPLGPIAADRLQAAVGVPDSEREGALKVAFQDTSFRTLHPKKESDVHSSDLECSVLSADTIKRRVGFIRILKEGREQMFLDRFLDGADDRALADALTETHGSHARLIRTLNQVEPDLENWLSAASQAERLKWRLGLQAKSDFVSKTQWRLNLGLQKGLDYVSLQDSCDLVRLVPELSLSQDWLRGHLDSNTLHFAGCLPRPSTSLIEEIKDFVLSTDRSAPRREALRSLKGYWGNDTRLLDVMSSLPLRDLLEAKSSLGDYSKPANSHWQTCLNEVSPIPGDDAHDARLWTCFRSYLPTAKDLCECLGAAREFRTDSGLGARWGCLKQFPDSVTLAAFLEAARQTQDSEKADDFLSYGWDALRRLHEITKPECLGITEKMRIPGNQIKQNWNCVHQS